MTASCGPCPTMGCTRHRVSPENRDMLYGFWRRRSAHREPACREMSGAVRLQPYRAREDQLDGESFRAAPTSRSTQIDAALHVLASWRESCPRTELAGRCFAGGR